MNFEELKKQIEELQKKVAILEGGCKRWRAEANEKYWCIIDECVYRSLEANENCDKARYEIGNYFRTEEEAEKAVEKIKIYTQLKDLALRLNNGEKIDWENDEQEKYYIYYDNTCNMLTYGEGHGYHDIGQIYCLDENFVDIAKQEIGEKNLKKLFE